MAKVEETDTRLLFPNAPTVPGKYRRQWKRGVGRPLTMAEKRCIFDRKGCRRKR